MGRCAEKTSAGVGLCGFGLGYAGCGLVLLFVAMIVIVGETSYLTIGSRNFTFNVDGTGSSLRLYTSGPEACSDVYKATTVTGPSEQVVELESACGQEQHWLERWVNIKPMATSKELAPGAYKVRLRSAKWSGRLWAAVGQHPTDKVRGFLNFTVSLELVIAGVFVLAGVLLGCGLLGMWFFRGAREEIPFLSAPEEAKDAGECAEAGEVTAKDVAV
uniref:Uncharacterized protein n=1 Tax=Zooxanthella nutricula TaxID=1333877 RepID=A0A7S2P6I2_9DINO|mmetsp:Transcript_48666/g.148048  ORF Transcript_48666/g.148048 Transcript_48666/m.148048 type:complete len:217 (+) Transcript_48666:111-761(+)